jgi:mevalonate kinase
MPLNIFCMKPAIEYHASGKLLITGEYLVLAGARALAMPVRFGQRMIIHETARRILDWESSSPDGTWFSARFDPDTLEVISADKMKIAIELNKILLAARRLNPEFLTGSTGWNVNVTANYPVEWGLGSSSTLYSLVARWAGVLPYDLFRMISQGSGYDIACAARSGLLYYQLRQHRPEITEAYAGRALRENTCFAYLGHKQDTQKEVTAFLEDQNYSENDLAEISRLSAAICDAGSPDELIALVDEHEAILGNILKREPIERRYPSFPGTVKSLGAWGGDFAMFVSPMEPATVADHLHRLGFKTVFRFNELEINS